MAPGRHGMCIQNHHAGFKRFVYQLLSIPYFLFCEEVHRSIKLSPLAIRRAFHCYSIQGMQSPTVLLSVAGIVLYRQL